MKIKSFYTTSPLFEGGRFDETKPICVFSESPIFLHNITFSFDMSYWSVLYIMAQCPAKR